MTEMTTRHAKGTAARSVATRGWAVFAGATVVIMAVSSVAGSYGISAARAGTNAKTAKTEPIKPITIAGRWSGFQYSSTFVPPRTSGESQRNLTLDIVACA